MTDRSITHLLVLLGVLSGCANSLPQTPRVASPASPVIPDREIRLTDFGATGNGTTLDTAAFEKAIAACAQAGGGKIIVPPGRYLIGPIDLTSNLELHLEKGATILLRDDIDSYPLRDPKSYDDGIFADGCHDIAITGEGTIDGQGQKWWDKYRKKPGVSYMEQPSMKLPHRPHLIFFNNCTRVAVTGVTLTNSPMFHLVPQQCFDVCIDGISIIAPANSPNTDGVDPSGRNHLITNCYFDCGDDNIAIKPQALGTKPYLSCEDITVTNCRFMRGHGMSVGGQTPGGLQRLTVRNCTFEDTTHGIRLKASRGAGGLTQECLFENLTMKNVRTPILITSYYQVTADPLQDPAQPVTMTTPIWRNIVFRNVHIEGSENAGAIIGVPEMWVFDVELRNVHIAAKTGMRIIRAREIRFIDSTIDVQEGEKLIQHDATVTGLKD